MRIYSLLLLLVCTLILAPVRSQAGFLVKHRTQTAIILAQHKAATALEQSASTDPDGHNCEKKRRADRREGWAGTASMWVAIGGAVYAFFPPIMIVSLVFAAIGMKPGKPKRGRAIAGLIISIVGLFIWGFAIAAGMWW